MADYPTSFDRDALLACARGELFGEGNAQLPLPPMLMMDRITDVSADGGEHGKGHIVAEFDISPDLWFFDCHFPGNPIMPGCLGLDGLWQLTGFNLGWRGWQGRGYALGVGEVKLTGMVRPDRKMLTYVGLFRAKPGVALLDDHTFTEPEYNTYACPWHNNLTAAICSFRAAKALTTNAGSRHDIDSFTWYRSVPFDWHSQQLLELGLMEPGQWF